MYNSVASMMTVVPLYLFLKHVGLCNSIICLSGKMSVVHKLCPSNNYSAHKTLRYSKSCS